MRAGLDRRTFADVIAPEPLAAKVPEITFMFWVIKILTTAGGEAVSDYLALGNRMTGAVVETGVLLIGLVWQFRTRRYTAAAYWFLAYAIAIFGTGVSDALHLFVGIPYAGTSLLWAVVLAAVFWLWNRSEGTLSIHSIVTRRRESYYWAVVFATFALGTALGDFTGTTLGLGYLASGIMFFLIIGIPAVAWARYGLDSIAALLHRRLLVRLRGDPSAGRLVRRLLRQVAVTQRNRVRLREDCGHHRGAGRRGCRLSRRHPARRPAAPRRRTAGQPSDDDRQARTRRLLTGFRVSRKAWSGSSGGSRAGARKSSGPSRNCRPSSRSTPTALPASPRASSRATCPWA